MSRRRALWLPGLVLLLGALVSGAARAHDLEITETVALVKADGRFLVDMTVDLDALALGVAPGTDSAQVVEALEGLPPEELEERVERLRTLFARRVRVLADGERTSFETRFPDRVAEPVEVDGEPTLLGLTARLEGDLPEGAEAVAFRASRAFPPVLWTVLDQRTLRGHRELLELGGESRPFAVGEEVAEAGAGGEGGGERAEGLSTTETLGRYLVLGFWHIVPKGLDHILFVLGLFLVATRLRTLLLQVTAFTLAHTVTLGLATYGVLNLSPSVVEPLIAFSILVVGLEGLWVHWRAGRALRDRADRAGQGEAPPSRWRHPLTAYLLVFGFGLVHGLGFAGVLGLLGLPPGERPTALVGFNLGVEAGQLAVLLAAFVLLGPLRRRFPDRYRRWVAIPLCLAIAVAGLVWGVERVL